MSSEIIGQPTEHHTDLLRAGRRASVILDAGSDAYCTVFSGDSEPIWSANVLEITADQVALLLRRQPDIGTGLTVTLRGAAGTAFPLSAQVAGSRFHPSGKWLIRCRFDTKLSAEQLQSLLQDHSTGQK